MGKGERQPTSMENAAAQAQQSGMREALEGAASRPTIGDQQRAAAAVAPPTPPLPTFALTTKALTNPIALAREYALAAAEVCGSTQLQPQSRKNVCRLLRLALELVGE